MKHIINKKNLKKKGLTLVEVLVSVILTALLMLYGTSFFMASWRLSAESTEYSMILQDVVCNLESFKSGAHPLATSSFVQQKIMREKYIVTYTVDITTSSLKGFMYITSQAKWSYGGDEDSNNAISIKSAFADNRWEKIV